MMNRFSRTGTLISSLFNVWLFNGNPDESISARCYRQGLLGDHRGWSLGMTTVDRIFFWEPCHCYKSYCTDVNNAKVLLKGSGHG